MKYLAADYTSDFACKCGACRHNCCSGWPVTISREEYERIMAAPAGPEYREKLTEALHLNFAPDDGRYAHVVHDRQGRCLLQREDGLCGLQIELGEAILPAVCRLYPRNRRSVCGVNECALSFGCEAVTERLLASAAPLMLTETEIGEAPLFPIDMTAEKYARCRRALEIMGDRSTDLSQRFERLGEELFGCRESSPEEQALEDAMRLLHRLTSDCCGKTKVAGKLCIEAVSFFGFAGKEKLSGAEAAELYDRYRETAGRLFPEQAELEALAERFLINHMFYNNFPHVGGTDDGERALYGLCTVYAFLKFVLAGNVRRIGGREDAADVLSELGRLVEHSDLKYRAAQFYRKQSDYSPGYWRQLAKL